MMMLTGISIVSCLTCFFAFGVSLFTDYSMDLEGYVTAQSKKKGKELFNTYCNQCHGIGGRGAIGPNLTDDYWIHGASNREITKIVKKGVLSKGMRSFEDQLLPKDIKAVVSYVETLRGTNIKGGKKPQGHLYKKRGVRYVPDLKNKKVKTARAIIPSSIPVIAFNGDAKKGKKLFNISLGCSHCHGQDSKGFFDNRNLRETKKRYNKDWLRVIDYTLIKGRQGTAMPTWAHVSKSQLRDVKTYLVSIQKK